MTGVTGFLGRVVARELFASWPTVEIWALVRSNNGTDPRHRPELAEFASNPRFHVLVGDLTRPDLGLVSSKIGYTAESGSLGYSPPELGNRIPSIHRAMISIGR